jgi:hypothetical protein
VANGKWHIESHYPTQAKERLEWGTRHLSPMWQKLHPHTLPTSWQNANHLAACEVMAIASLMDDPCLANTKFPHIFIIPR